MAANVTAPVDELDESDQRPMTDTEHHATFGWGWDDPDRVEDFS